MIYAVVETCYSTVNGGPLLTTNMLCAFRDRNRALLKMLACRIFNARVWIKTMETMNGGKKDPQLEKVLDRVCGLDRVISKYGNEEDNEDLEIDLVEWVKISEEVEKSLDAIRMLDSLGNTRPMVMMLGGGLVE